MIVSGFAPADLLLGWLDVTEGDFLRFGWDLIERSVLLVRDACHETFGEARDFIELGAGPEFGVNVVKGGLELGVISCVEGIGEGGEGEMSLKCGDVGAPVLIDGIGVVFLRGSAIGVAGENAEFGSFLSDEVLAVEGELSRGIGDGDDGVGVVVALVLGIEVADEAVDRNVRGDAAGEGEGLFVRGDGEVVEIGVSVDLGGLLGTGKERVGGEPEGVCEFEVSAGSFFSELAGVGFFTFSHEGAVAFFSQDGGGVVVG